MDCRGKPGNDGFGIRKDAHPAYSRPDPVLPMPYGPVLASRFPTPRAGTRGTMTRGPIR